MKIAGNCIRASVFAGLVFLALVCGEAQGRLFVRFQPDQRLSNIVVKPGDLIPLVISEDTDYRTRAARMGCHVWCVASTARAVSVSAPGTDGNATFSDVILDSDTSPASDFQQLSFTENIADPALWDGGPRDLVDITFEALAPGTLDQMIHDITAFDVDGNQIPIDFDTTNPLVVTVVPEPATLTLLLTGAMFTGRRRGRRLPNRQT